MEYQWVVLMSRMRTGECTCVLMKRGEFGGGLSVALQLQNGITAYISAIAGFLRDQVLAT